MSTQNPDPASLPGHDTDRIDDIASVAVLEEPNRRRLYELVSRAHADVGRDQAADQLGISRELAAFHLDRLVAAGLLAAGYRRLSGRSGPGAGRPAKVYRRAAREVSVSLPPRSYATIAGLFADGLEALGGVVGADVVGNALAGPARALGREAGAEARATAGRRPTHERLVGALRELLARRGYEPEVDAAGAVSLCNCPYLALSAAHRDLTCGANRAWADGVVDGLRDERLAVEFAPTAGRCCVRFAES